MIRKFLLTVTILAPLPATAAEFEFKDGDRVVLIGSTLIEREQRYGYWEAALTAANPDKNITFRNLGWSGDTVWGEARAGFGTPADGYKALIDHVKAEKPTVIIVGYGTNESFAGEAGLPKFKEQLKKLLDDLAVAKARLVLLSPIEMVKMPPPLPDPANANANLKLYGKAIEGEANHRGAVYVSFFGSWSDPFGFVPPRPEDFDNGMHLSHYGYSDSASYFATHLGSRGLLLVRIDAKRNRVDLIDGGRIVVNGSNLRFKIVGDVLPAEVVTVGSSAAFVGRAFLIHGLSDGSYTMTVDGQAIKTATAKEWQVMNVVGKSEADQVHRLRQTIIAKNELYFHRWRPANVTYLFGFRKHEQGNNAVEIPQFDPLVEAKEKEIAKLRKPVEHVYELVPVKEKK